MLGYRFGASGVSLNLWSSLSFRNKEVNEFRFVLKYGHQIGANLALETGLIHYGWYFSPAFRFKDDTSHELFVVARYQNSTFSPSLTTYYDFTNGDGFYLLLDVAYKFKYVPFIPAELYASLGYNGGQWLAEGVDPGFSDLNLKMSIPVSLGRLQIAPFAAYTVVLLEALGKENFFLYGISIQYR